MRGWSFPLGRWFGVDLRIHTFFLLLLGFCLLSTGVAGLPAWRGIMLWLLLLFVVFVREFAKEGAPPGEAGDLRFHVAADSADEQKAVKAAILAQQVR